MKTTTLLTRSLLLILTPLLLLSCRSNKNIYPPMIKELTKPQTEKPKTKKTIDKKPRAPKTKHPVIIVLDFENNTGFRGQWNLERIIPGLLNNNLHQDSKFILLDRSLFNTVAGQLARGGRSVFSNPKFDDLQRADYAISGTLTDFRSINDTSGLFAPPLEGEKQAQLACSISLDIRVADVKSGHLIKEFERSYTLRAEPGEAPTDYNNIDFGSNLFTYTPLGRITDAVLQDISENIIKIIKKDQSSGRKRDNLQIYAPDSGRTPSTRATSAPTTTRPSSTTPKTPRTSTPQAGKISLIGKDGNYWIVNAGEKHNLRVGNHALARTFDGTNYIVSGLLSIKSITATRSLATLIEGTVEKGSVLEIID